MTQPPAPMNQDPLPIVLPNSLPDPLPPDPFPLLCAWLEEARAAKWAPNPDAMVLATCTTGGRPSARVVLCKAIDPRAGTLTFYTNYRSPKAADLEANPRAAAVFHWDHAARQARVEGTVSHLSEAESDAYFATRPVLSKLGAWASDQSQPVSVRWKIAGRVADFAAKFGLTADLKTGPGAHIPRPAHWGGYRIRAARVELWIGGEGRLHDRAAWTRTVPSPSTPGAGGPKGCAGWISVRLQP